VNRRRLGFIVRLAIALLAVGVAGPPVGAQQVSRIAKIGMLFATTRAAVAQAQLMDEFRQGLRDHGHVEGKDFVLEIRYAEAGVERLPELARELVGLKPDVIVAVTDPSIVVVKRETQTIPIVMAFSADPAGTGLVASLARPGGNVTGLSTIAPELSGKRVELLREVVPGLSRVALLWNPDVRGSVLDYKEAEAAARSLHLELQSVELSRVEDLDRALSAVMKGRAQALIVVSNPMVVARRGAVASFAQRNRPPSMSGSRLDVEAGGLMSYGPNFRDMFRRAAAYVDKILKGAKPGDLPVEQPIRFELVINLKTARALGLTIPQSLLGRADQVIQ
jgi:putative ABC transport system substrate-binding protein